MDASTAVDLLRQALVGLNRAVGWLSTQIPEPVFAEEDEGVRLRHLQFDSDLLVRLKALRVLSGINAALLLHSEGFYQEVAVLIRVVRHSLDDILFMIAAERGTEPEPAYTQFMRGFYEQRVPSATELREGRRPKHEFPPRRKITAAVSRVLGVTDPSTFTAVQAAEDAALDGYVHPAYGQIMEMYNVESRTFETAGSTDLTHSMAVLGYLANTIAVALGVFAVLASRDRDQELFDLLRELQGELKPLTTIGL